MGTLISRPSQISPEVIKEIEYRHLQLHPTLGSHGETVTLMYTLDTVKSELERLRIVNRLLHLTIEAYKEDQLKRTFQIASSLQARALTS